MVRQHWVHDRHRTLTGTRVQAVVGPCNLYSGRSGVQNPVLRASAVTVVAEHANVNHSQNDNMPKLLTYRRACR